MSHNSSTGGGFLVGGVVGYLVYSAFQYRIVQLAAMFGAFVLCVNFIQDWRSEEWIAGTETHLYTMDVTSIDRTPQSSTPLFSVDYTLDNRSDEFLQRVELTTVLYECPSPTADVTSCRAVSTKPLEITVDKPAGFVFRDHKWIGFPDTQAVPNMDYIVQLNVNRLQYDADRKLN